MKENQYYCYIALDTRRSGEWEFRGIKFEFQPFYVGKGKGPRIGRHIKELDRSKMDIKNKKIDKIIQETGEPPIFRKVYENLSENDAFAGEIDMIAHFGRLDIGTGILANLTDGGPGMPRAKMSAESLAKRTKTREDTIFKRSKRVDQKDLKGNFIKKFDSLTQIKKEFQLTKKEINQIRTNCNGDSKNALGYIWEFDGTSAYTPPVKQPPLNQIIVSKFDLDGVFIETYPSIQSAAKSCNISGTSVSRCCSNHDRAPGGFQWRYGEFTENIGKANLNFTPYNVFQYGLDGYFIAVHKNLTSAAKSVERSPTTLLDACKGINCSAAGFQWFKEDRGLFVPPVVKSDKTPRAITVYNENQEIVEIFDSLGEVSLKYGIPVIQLRTAINKQKSINGKFYKRVLPSEKEKAVFQYSYDGLFVKSWDNSLDAEIETGVSYEGIRSCCLGKNFSSGGFQWSYEYKGEVIPSLKKEKKETENRKIKGIFALNSKMEIVFSFNSLADARRAGYAPGPALKYPERRSGGYFWRYSKGYTSAI